MPSKTIIHVNQHVIRRNKRTGERNPPIAVRLGRYGKPTYVSEVVLGTVLVCYRPDDPLPCGATVWIEGAPYDPPRHPSTLTQVKKKE